LFVAAQALAGVLFMTPKLPAQQVAPSQAAEVEVPGNPLRPAPPEQPIPYSHKIHLALALQCEDCHTNPEPANLMTFPATAKCMQCHAAVAKGKPSIEKLADFARSQKPIPWVRVYTVLPGVRWSHRKHLDAGLQCETCHGQVAQRDAMAEATSVTAMAVCINCHEMNHAPASCNTCHPWP
jgi:hypothetical protein